MKIDKFLILIFTKTGKGGTSSVWFYDMTADGYSLDDKRQKIENDDIPDILNRWNNKKSELDRKRTDKSSILIPVPLPERSLPGLCYTKT